MREIRIIGVGSPFGDDQIGWAVIEALNASGMLDHLPRHRVEAICCERAGGLLAELEGVRKAIVIDAMRSGLEIGSFRRFTPGDLLPERNFLSSHGIGVAETLSLGRVLMSLPSMLLVYGIEIQAIAPCEEMHPEVRKAIPRVLEAIAFELQGHL